MANKLEPIGINIGFIVRTKDTPELPNAKRGDFSATNVQETKEQLDTGLIWVQCMFCEGFVLVACHIEPQSRKREKCQCGAKRIFRWGRISKEERESGFTERTPVDGWRKDGKEWVIC